MGLKIEPEDRQGLVGVIFFLADLFVTIEVECISMLDGGIVEFLDVDHRVAVLVHKFKFFCGFGAPLCVEFLFVYLAVIVFIVFFKLLIYRVFELIIADISVLVLVGIIECIFLGVYVPREEERSHEHRDKENGFFHFLPPV